MHTSWDNTKNENTQNTHNNNKPTHKRQKRIFQIDIQATLAIATKLFKTTAVRVKSDIAYPEFKNFFAKGEI